MFYNVIIHQLSALICLINFVDLKSIDLSIYNNTKDSNNTSIILNTIKPSFSTILNSSITSFNSSSNFTKNLANSTSQFKKRNGRFLFKKLLNLVDCNQGGCCTKGLNLNNLFGFNTECCQPQFTDDGLEHDNRPVKHYDIKTRNQAKQSDAQKVYLAVIRKEHKPKMRKAHKNRIKESEKILNEWPDEDEFMLSKWNAKTTKGQQKAILKINNFYSSTELTTINDEQINDIFQIESKNQKLYSSMPITEKTFNEINTFTYHNFREMVDGDKI